jgi:hypothetical protein
MNQAQWYSLSKADCLFINEKLIWHVRAVASAKILYLNFAYKKILSSRLVLWIEIKIRVRNLNYNI